MTFDYIAEANLTLSNKFHGEKITMAELRKRIQAFLDAGEALDQVKKALFYGKGEDIGLTNSLGARNAIEAPYLVAGVEIPLLTSDLTGTEVHRVNQAEVLIHAALGKATEAVEFLEAIFKAMNLGEPPDRVNLLEEIGDGFWYDAIALKALASEFEVEQRRNIAKLRLRFPNNFTEYDAQHRDLEGERDVLEGSHYAFALATEDEAYLKGAEFDGAWVDELEGEREVLELHTIGEAEPRLIEGKARFATRCPHCGLRSRHRPSCPNFDLNAGVTGKE